MHIDSQHFNRVRMKNEQYDDRFNNSLSFEDSWNQNSILSTPIHKRFDINSFRLENHRILKSLNQTLWTNAFILSNFGSLHRSNIYENKITDRNSRKVHELSNSEEMNLFLQMLFWAFKIPVSLQKNIITEQVKTWGLYPSSLD